MATQSGILLSSTPELEDPLFSSIPQEEISKTPVIPFTVEERAKLGKSYRNIRIKFINQPERTPVEFLVNELQTIEQFTVNLKEQFKVPVTEAITLQEQKVIIPSTKLIAEFKVEDPLASWIELDLFHRTVSSGWASSWYCLLI
jgi:hypothetical protein